MSRSKAGLRLFAAALALAAPPAAAQTPSVCGCSAPPGSSGLVRTALGMVFVSRETGFTPARPDTPFSLPARVLAGPRSSSTIDIGRSCRITLAENQSLDIGNDAGGRWCVRVVEGRQPPMVPPSAVAGFIPFAAASGLVVGAVVFSIARAEDKVSH